MNMSKILRRIGLVLASVMAVILFSPTFSCNDYEDENDYDYYTPPPKPSRPWGLKAEAISISQINLSWEYYEDKKIGGFKIERSLTDESNYTEIATTAKDVTEFDDENLESGTKYYYRVRAYKKKANSDYCYSSFATTIFEGYMMCLCRVNMYWFGCLEKSQCEQRVDNNSYFALTGAEIFDCLDLQLIAPMTMIVSFTYRASASSCYNQPYLEIVAGSKFKRFYWHCSDSGYASIAIEVEGGLVASDIVFGLFSGDWCSAVRIENITFIY